MSVDWQDKMISQDRIIEKQENPEVSLEDLKQENIRLDAEIVSKINAFSKNPPEGFEESVSELHSELWIAEKDHVGRFHEYIQKFKDEILQPQTTQQTESLQQTRTQPKHTNNSLWSSQMITLSDEQLKELQHDGVDLSSLSWLNKILEHQNEEEKLKNWIEQLSPEIFEKQPYKILLLLLQNNVNMNLVAQEQSLFMKMSSMQRQNYVEWLGKIWKWQLSEEIKLWENLNVYKKIYALLKSPIWREYFLTLARYFVTLNKWQKTDKKTPAPSRSNEKQKVYYKDNIEPFNEKWPKEQEFSKKELQVLFPDFRFDALLPLFTKSWVWVDWQGWVWDCYLMSAVNSIRNHADFFDIMKKTLKKTKEWYSFTIPLGSVTGEKISITEAELQHAGARWLWYQIFELAYVKYTKKIDTITSRADVRKIDWGYAPLTLEELLGKENIKNHTLSWYVTEWGKKALNGSRQIKEIDDIYTKYLLWKKNPSNPTLTEKELSILQRENAFEENFPTRLKEAKKRIAQDVDKNVSLLSQKVSVEQNLGLANPPKHALNASTLPWVSDTIKIVLDNKRILYRSHAYSIQSIAKNPSTGSIERVVVFNPHNTDTVWGKTVALTLDEFCTNFSRVSVWVIRENWWKNNTTQRNIAAG